ncbi:chaoptin-like [Diabrotica virgifera virgifera]|uniref:Uncharacterized protein n=1 Tax=Diabrotica virgifera virgifera TaxID=50390 RepID=A0ABM5ID08_DIAVI|nr:chaoptin-like [Diabrotica virgifera virgifera]
MDLHIIHRICILFFYLVQQVSSFKIGCRPSSETYYCNSISKLFPPTEANNCNHLIIFNSTLSTIDATLFTRFGAFTTFTLSNIHVREISPGSFADISNLEHLYLDHNNLTTIEKKVVQNLRKLQTLDISYNSITYIASEAFTGTKISSLNISGNSLSDFNCNIKQLTTLNTLDLSHNKLLVFDLETLPNSTKTLIVARNNLENLQECKCIDSGCMSLEILDLSFNNFSSLKRIHFTHLLNLQSLFLQGNQLISLSSDLFSNLNKIQYLNVSSNHIKIVPYQLFDNQLYLKTLDLSNNEIKVFKPLMYQNLFNLDSLYLQNNSLDYLNVPSFQSIGLKYISLDDNNFLCNNLMRMLNIFKSSNITVYNAKHVETSNINDLYCIPNDLSPSSQYLTSNIKTVVFVSLAVVLVTISIPWIWWYRRRKVRSRESEREITLFSGS